MTALDVAKPIDEKPAVQVVDLVLQGAREQFLAFDEILTAAAIQRTSVSLSPAGGARLGAPPPRRRPSAAIDLVDRSAGE